MTIGNTLQLASAVFIFERGLRGAVRYPRLCTSEEKTSTFFDRLEEQECEINSEFSGLNLNGSAWTGRNAQQSRYTVMGTLSRPIVNWKNSDSGTFRIC